MAKMNLFTTVAQIDKAIGQIKSRGVKLQDLMHKTACSVLNHVIEHRDVRVVTRFLDAMPDMARSNSLRKWFETFGPVAFDVEGKITYSGNKPVDLGKAYTTPFWTFTAPEGEAYKPIDPVKLLEQMIKRFERDSKETKRDHSATILALKCIPVTKVTAQAQAIETAKAA